MIAISAPREYTQIAEIIAEQLKQINIDVSVEPQEIGTFVESINSEFDWASTGGGMRGDPSGYFSCSDRRTKEPIPIFTAKAGRTTSSTSSTTRRWQRPTRPCATISTPQLQELVLDENPYLYTVQSEKFQVVNRALPACMWPIPTSTRAAGGLRDRRLIPGAASTRNRSTTTSKAPASCAEAGARATKGPT